MSTAVVTNRQGHFGAPPQLAATVPVRDAPRWTYVDMLKAILGVTIATLIAGLIAAVIADSLLEPGQEYEDNPTAYAIVLFPSMVGVEIFLLAAALWFGPRKYRQSLAVLGVRKPERGAWWLPAVMAVASLVIVYGYEGALSLIGVDTAGTPDEVFDNAGPFMVVALGAVILAPAIEEVFFRGFLFGGIREHRGWVLAALASSVLFALAHLDIYGLPAYAAIGFLFAWSYQFTGSIKSPMIAHAIVNAVTVGVALAISG